MGFWYGVFTFLTALLFVLPINFGKKTEVKNLGKKSIMFVCFVLWILVLMIREEKLDIPKCFVEFIANFT